ncbi:MAG: flavodoxin, partial [Clostridium sp.]|nr:flavodoxin [Clostridium sp.]
NCDLKVADDITIEELEKYDVIIYGGGLYAVGINGLALIKKNYDLLCNKKIVIWATGASTGREEELQQVWDYNFNK